MYILFVTYFHYCFILIEKNWFEREQQAAEAAKSEEAAATAARRETSSVPLLSGAAPEYLRCYLCHDNFHQFYNHDIDEWHLRNAVEFEGNNYHPICLDDHKVLTYFLSLVEIFYKCYF